MRASYTGLQRWSLAIAVALMIVWGVNFSVTKQILEQVSVNAFLFLRFLARHVVAQADSG